MFLELIRLNLHFKLLLIPNTQLKLTLQLDALQLDNDITRIIRDQLAKSLQSLSVIYSCL